MKTLNEYLKPYSRAIVRLMKSPVTSDSVVWNDIVSYQTEIQEYIAVIGLELIVKSDEGYAFAQQMVDEEGHTIGITPRRKIGFESSVVLIVLRQKMEEFDDDPVKELSKECEVTVDEIREELELFFPSPDSDTKILREVDKHLKHLVELGYLKENKGLGKEGRYIVQRIIKEKVTLDVLHEFKQKLENDVKSI